MTTRLDNSVDDVFVNINANVSMVVRILMTLRSMEQKHLATALAMDQATLSRSLNNQRPWKLEDLPRLAAVFDRPIPYFFEDPDTLVRNRCFREADQHLVGAAA